MPYGRRPVRRILSERRADIGIEVDERCGRAAARNRSTTSSVEARYRLLWLMNTEAIDPAPSTDVIVELLIQANLVAVVDQPPMTLCGRGGVPAGVGGRLQHIGIGRMHTGTHVPLLVQDLHVRVIDAAAGELFRVLDSGPTRDYRTTGWPPGPT